MRANAKSLRHSCCHAFHVSLPSVSFFKSKSTQNISLAVPIGMPIMAFGQRCHHLVICAGSVLASLWPFFVSGRLSSGLHGNTALPCAAWANAACSIVCGMCRAASLMASPPRSIWSAYCDYDQLHEFTFSGGEGSVFALTVVTLTEPDGVGVNETDNPLR